MDFRANSGGLSSADAGTAVAIAPTAASDAAPVGTVAVVEGAACQSQDLRGELVTGAAIYPCRCVASHSGSLVWDCDRTGGVVEGPLPPPELAAMA